ncbi:protein wntless-like [Pollicipes pollicipes]|nr:protein wntless-like [Pollicipes pollicipes]
MRLGGRDGGENTVWEELGRAEQPLNVHTCESRPGQPPDNTTASPPDNSTAPATERCVVNQRLFQTPSLDRQFYLLNTRVQHMTQPPLSMALVVVTQTRLFTLVCLNIQACFMGLLLLMLLVFGVRVQRVYRTVPTGHKLLAVLAVALLIWDIPVGYAALDYDMPWLGLLDDIRMDVFYLVFLSFCLIFVWEQGFIKGATRRLASYWRSQLLLLLGWLLLLVLDVYQQTRQMGDVFSPRPDWLRYCLAALLVANALYVVLACVAAGASWRRGWKSAALPCRYRAAMLLTCLTLAAACVEHAERREADNSWFWSWTEIRPTGGHLFYIGMLVWSNMYVLTLLILYTPTRPLVELTKTVYEDEQKVPLNGSGDACALEPITRREAATGGDDARQPMIAEP